MEKTLVLIKPDCLHRKMAGLVITLLESSGLNISYLCQRFLTLLEAEQLYAEHRGRWFFDRNIKHVMSGEVIIVRVEGDNAVNTCRGVIERFRAAHKDVIKLPRNLVHATSELEKASGELIAVGITEPKAMVCAMA